MDLIKKIFHQLSWQLIAKVISAFSTIILLSIITRTFGADGTGVYTLALTYLAFFYLAADLGLNGFYLNYYAENSVLPNRLFNFRLGWSFILVIFSLIILPLLPFSTTQFILSVMIGGFSIVLNGIFNSTNFVFQHFLAYSKSSIASAVGSLASLVSALVLSVFHFPIYYFMLAPLIGWLITALLCWVFVRKFYHFTLTKPEWLFPVETLKIAWPVAATLLINTLYFRIDAFILSSTQSYADVGAYNLAYQIFQNILVIPTFIMNGYYPLMLRTMKENIAQYKKHFQNALFLMMGLGVSGFVGLYFFASLIIRLLSGNGFDGSITTLQILSSSLPAFFVSSLLMWLMMAKKMYRLLLVIYLIALIVNFLANWYLIPVFSFIAASWVTVGSEYLILILQVLILLRYQKK
jgi:O-antigen/teichoic acid export membrane protein